MTVELVTLGIVLAFLAAGAIWEWRAERRELRRQEEVAEVLTSQLPADDEYTICPVCHLMGRHTRELVERKPCILDCGVVVEYLGPTKFYVRTCAFYPEHTWGAPYRGEDT